MGALRTYVRDEFKDKRQQDVDTSAWPISCAPLQPCSGTPDPRAKPQGQAAAGGDHVGVAHLVPIPAALLTQAHAVSALMLAADHGLH